MTRIPIAVLSLVLTGCSALQGTMLDGRLCTLATDQDAQRDVRELVDLYTPAHAQADAEKYLTMARLTAGSICEIRRAAAASAAH